MVSTISKPCTTPATVPAVCLFSLGDRKNMRKFVSYEVGRKGKMVFVARMR